MDPPHVIYKHKCCVPGCFDRTAKRHRFPKNNNMCSQWIQLIQNPVLMNREVHEIYNSFYVCHNHFAEEYLSPGTRRGLSHDALPTLNIAGIDDTSNITSKATGTENIPTLDPTTTVQVFPSTSSILQLAGSIQSAANPQIEAPTVDNITPPLKSSPSDGRKRRSFLKVVNVTRQSQLTPRCKKMYNVVTAWAKKTAKLQHKFGNLQNRLLLATKAAQQTCFSDLVNSVNDLTYKFILQQVRTQKQAPKVRRFSLEEKILSLTLLKTSGKGYRLLSKIFALPSRRTLTNLLNKLPYRPGINKQVENSLRSVIASLSENERLCAVVFDEISISPLLHYSSKYDCIEGLTDLGFKRYPHIADHANVFLIKGVYRQWKQPLSFTFSSGPLSSTELKNMIKDIVTMCERVGLEVVATICDQGAGNQAAINSLLKETNEFCVVNKIPNNYLGILINNKEVIPLYDVPHLFKGLRNNLLNKDLHFNMHGVDQVATWKHIEQLYFLDTYDDTRMLIKLTDNHVIPNKINKMKVSSMTQVFSYAVGSHLQRFAGWDTNTEYSLPPAAKQTGAFVLFVDALFDSLNGNNKLAPVSKPLKGALTKTSPHEAFWTTAIHVLRTMKFLDSSKRKLVHVPSIKNLVYTIKGFIYLKKKLLNKVSYVLPRAFNQDSLENFFASVRSHGRRNVSPSAFQFISSFKALLINNFLSSHSVFSNCEKDFNVGALHNLRTFLTGEEIVGISPLDISICENVPEILHVKKTRVAKATIAYLAGYVGKKVLSKTNNCSRCKILLTASDNDVPLDVIEARQYKRSSLFRPGSYLYFIVGQACSYLFYLIPRHCHKFGIQKILAKKIAELLNFNVLNCEKHTQLGSLVLNFIIKTVLHFWCKQINRISNGLDERFSKLVATRTDLSAIDQVKLEALKKYKSKCKLRHKYKKDASKP